MMTWRQDEATLADQLPSLLHGARRVLVVVPNATRPAPIAEMTPQVLDDVFGFGCQADGIVALGTQPPMTATKRDKYDGIRLMNHAWDQPSVLPPFCEKSDEYAASQIPPKTGSRVGWGDGGSSILDISLWKQRPDTLVGETSGET